MPKDLFYSDMRNKIGFFTLILIGFTFSNAYTQFNAKVGYTLNYTDSDVNNDIFNAFNTTNSQLRKQFDALYFLNGINIGLRYKHRSFGTQLNWERVTARRESIGNNTSGISLDNFLKYRFTRYILNFEYHNLYFVFGAGIYLEQNRIQTLLNNGDSNEDVLVDYDWGNKIYLSFPVQTSRFLSFAIEPFVLIPWTESNLFDLNTYLSSPANLQSFNQRNYHFGVSLVFYNGWQN